MQMRYPTVKGMSSRLDNLTTEKEINSKQSTAKEMNSRQDTEKEMITRQDTAKEMISRQDFLPILKEMTLRYDMLLQTQSFFVRIS